MGGYIIILVIFFGSGLIKWLYDVVFKFLNHGMTYDEWYKKEVGEELDRGEKKLHKLLDEKFGVTEKYYVDKLTIACKKIKIKRKDEMEEAARLFTEALSTMTKNGILHENHPSDLVTVEELREFHNSFNGDIFQYVNNF